MKRQILLPGDLRKNIPSLYAQEKQKDPMVYVKFFNPYGLGTWYVLEFDGADTLFCYVRLHEDEYGYVSLKELEDVTACIFGRNFPELQGIERDEYFRPCPLSEELTR